MIFSRHVFLQIMDYYYYYYYSLLYSLQLYFFYFIIIQYSVTEFLAAIIAVRGACQIS